MRSSFSFSFDRLPSLVALAFFTIAAGGAGAGCSSDSSSTTTTTAAAVATTTISIKPSAFLGDVLCSNEDGALRSYVVTFFDHTDATHITTLPSSTPTACSQGVSYRFALADHTYSAEIDGYDEPTSALEPTAGVASGSRHMALRATGAELKPRWTASCGAIVPNQTLNGAFTKCAELVDDGSSKATEIVVDPRTALGDLRCAAVGGEVVSFDITPEGSPLPPISGIPCGGAPITYNAGITPNEPYTFRVEARSAAGGPVVWGTRCSVTPKEGFSNTAVCAPLASSGSIDVSIDDLLAAHGLACGADGVTNFEAIIAKPVVSTGPVPCGSPARISPLDPGDYTLTVRALRKDGSTALQAGCSATVVPGDTTVATCP